MPVAKKEKVTAAKTVKIPEAGAKQPFVRVTVTAAQEKEILKLLADGKNRREVSQAVGLSRAQVDKVRKAHGLHTPREARSKPAVKKAVTKKTASKTRTRKAS
jgi:hypothetical protein